MPEFEAHVEESVVRCIEAFHRKDNHDEACKAFLAELPVLSGPAGIHAYLACIAKAMSIGVVDLVDVGRCCHLAQMAMRAWKLAHPGENTAHPLPPKGNQHQKEEPSGPRPDARGPSHLGAGERYKPSNAPKTPTPLPPKGNHPENEVTGIAVSQLPDFETQKGIYKALRQQGFSLPSNSHLLKNPVEALFYCGLAETLRVNPRSAQADQAA